MKKTARISALLLALSLLLSMTALAAAYTENPSKSASVAPLADGCTVSFKNDNVLTLTYTNSAIQKGDQMVVLMLACSDPENGSYSVTESSVLYIMQTVAAADGSVTFDNIYPSQMANAAIVISSNNKNVPVVRAAAVKGSYVLGDADGVDGVTVNDALTILLHLAGTLKEPLTGSRYLAADVDKVDGVTVNDALRILQYLADPTAHPLG